jgi:hydrogenase maturation factor
MVKKKVELSEEEKQQQSLIRELKDIEDRLHLIPEPMFKLSIGDKVRIGTYIDTEVSEILFDGKVYGITYSIHHTNYGNPYTTHGNKRLIAWMDIRKEVSNETEIFVEREDLRLQYSQRTMGDLFSKAYKFGLNLDPEYQREHVWTIEDKISLIDSIFNNIDIGKFVYVHLGYSGEYIYEVLDGKQRIRAILDFYEDRFKYKGKYFSDLSNRDQDHFDGYSISYAEIQNATYEQKLKYFLKLNTGGRIMAKEHLEKVQKMLDEKEIK